MQEAVTFINEVGFPIAAALGLGFFIWKLINRIIDGMETKLDVLDDKVADQIEQMEQRLGTKLDSQHGILVALIDRVRSLDNEIIRQDTVIKTILGVPQLIDSNKIAKADRAGTTSGIAILDHIANSDQPSIRAASINSSGKPIKN